MKNGCEAVFRLPFFMRHPPRAQLLSVVLLGGALVFHEPIRQGAFSLLRLPFSLLRMGVRVLLAVPRLPSLAREHADLQAEVARLQVEDARLRDALRQAGRSDALRRLAPLPHALAASVIGRSTIPTQQTVLLNKGAQDGVTLESVVVGAEGVIGRVIELHPATCLVMLLTDPDSRVAALVERSRETALLVGRGLAACELVYLDAEADIVEGDRILTAGLGGAFPKGLLLGTVIRVVRDEGAGASTAWIRPATRLTQLEEVLCLRPPGS